VPGKQANCGHGHSGVVHADEDAVDVAVEHESDVTVMPPTIATEVEQALEVDVDVELAQTGGEQGQFCGL